MSGEFDALLSGTRIIPVITMHSATSAEPLAEALIANTPSSVRR